MTNQETVREDSKATIRESRDTTVREEQNAAATLREGQSAASPGSAGEGLTFQGYHIVRQLPTKGSEADIFVVEKNAEQYILKHYRYGINPKRDILLAIKALGESHPQEFIRLFDIDFDPASGRWYEIQEYVANGSLQSLIADRSPLTGAQQVTFFNDVAREVAQALHTLHQNNLLHLDLKPSNILLRSVHPLNLVLIDFGIATALDSDMSKKFTQVRGTPMYQSPESYSGGMGRPADWWGLGMILLEIAAGAHPFKGLSNNIIAYAIATEPVPIPENLDAGRKKLLRGLLIRDPEKRWGYEQVACWLTDDRGIWKHFENVPTAQMQLPTGWAGLSPIKFMNMSYQNLPDLAAAFLKDEQSWEKGREFLMRGYVKQWLESNNEFDAIVDMDKVMSGTDDPDEKLFRFARRFGGDVPFAFGGHLITFENLLLFAGKVLKRQPVTAMERKIVDSIANGVLLSCLDFYKQQGRLSERLRDLELVLETVKGKSQEQVAKILDTFIHPENYAPVLNGNMTIQEIAQKVEIQEQERKEQERKRFASPSDKVWTNSMGDNSTVASGRVDSNSGQSLNDSVSGTKTSGKAPVPAPQTSGGGRKRLGLVLWAVLLLAGLAAWHFAWYSGTGESSSSFMAKRHVAGQEKFGTALETHIPQSPNPSPLPRNSLLDKAFLDLCKSGTAVEIRDAINAGANVNAKDNDGVTPLMRAAIENSSVVVKMLLNAGANVNAENKWGQTPLFLAAKKNSPEVLRTLLEAGANVDTKNNNGWTPLMTAAMFNSTEMVKMLLDAGASVNVKDKWGQTPLMLAAWKNSPRTVNMLLNAGADVNAKSSYGYSRTPLMWAAGYNTNPEVVKALLEGGASVHDVDKKGRDALWYAQQRKQGDKEKIVQILKSYKIAGSGRETRSSLSDSDFFEVCESGTAEDVRKAIKNSANVNAKNKNGETPLMIAVDMGFLARGVDSEIIEALLNAGADVNAKDKNGRTALMMVGPIGPSEVVIRLLLNAGANVDIKDKDGQTALMNADLSLEGMKLLLRAGADVNAKDKNGETPLIRAVKGGWTVKAIGNGIGGYPEEVKLLLDAGADINAVDKKGHDALWYAQDNYRRAAKLKGDPEYDMLWDAQNNDQIVAMLKKRKGGLGARQSTPKQTSRSKTRPAGRS